MSNDTVVADILIELEPILDKIANMNKTEELPTLVKTETKVDTVNVNVNVDEEKEKEEESPIPQGTVQIIESKIVTKKNGEVFRKESPPENINL